MSGKISTNYYEPYEPTPLMENATNNFSFLQLNISFLCFHIEKLITHSCILYLLIFDIIGISESWLKLNKNNLNSVQIPGYHFEFTPAECNNRGTAIYIKKGLKYKLRNILQIYKSKELESLYIPVHRTLRI